jgi:peptidoglycan hydrolase CwlO-like protein
LLRATIAIVALLVVGSGAFIRVPVRADTASKLKAAEARLNSLIADVGQAAQQRDRLQGELDVLAVSIDKNQGSMEHTQGLIVDTQQTIAKVANDIQGQQSVLDERAKLAYENGPASNLEFFLGAQSLTDLQDRIQVVNAAAQSDQTLIDGMSERKNELHIRQAHLRRLEAQLRAKQEELRNQQRILDTKFAAQRQLLDRLASDQAEAQSLVSQLKIQQHKEYLEALRRAEERRRQQQNRGGGGGGGGGSGGNWVPGIIVRCPVAGPHAYSDSFGANRYSGGYHPHAGNDIMAQEGTPIVAPFNGRAEPGQNGLGGLTVTVYGSQGYVYNAHLSKYGASGQVSVGTVVGYVGHTGDTQTPHDHFEWHPNHIPDNPWRSPYGYTVIGSAIDPYPYLNAVC